MRDGATGLDYLRSRFLSPSTGRFMTRDTYAGLIQQPYSLHKYMYGHADPVNNTDPSGMFLAALGGMLSNWWGAAADAAAKIKAFKTVQSILGVLQDAWFIGAVVVDIGAAVLGDHTPLTDSQFNKGGVSYERSKKEPLFTKAGYVFYGDANHEPWLQLSLEYLKDQEFATPKKINIAVNLSSGEVTISGGVNLKLYENPAMKLELEIRAGVGTGKGLHGGVALALTAPGSFTLGGFSLKHSWKIWPTS